MTKATQRRQQHWAQGHLGASPQELLLRGCPGGWTEPRALDPDGLEWGWRPNSRFRDLGVELNPREGSY